jgi:hypothetical protein
MLLRPTDVRSEAWPKDLSPNWGSAERTEATLGFRVKYDSAKRRVGTQPSDSER